MSQDDEIEAIKMKRLEKILQSRQTEPGSNAKPMELTDATFAAEVSNHSIMVVDFWAPWCGPCRTVGPIIERLASEYAGKVCFGKLNVDENPQVAGAFGVQSIPTMIVFRNGQPVDGIVGAVPKAQIESRFQKYLNDPKAPASISDP